MAESLLHKWEWIDSFTARLRVPGGWLYLAYQVFDDPPRHVTSAMCFVPLSHRLASGHAEFEQHEKPTP